MFQSNEEILRVFADWFENVAPKNLINSASNGKLLADYVLERGVVSIGTINDAVVALGSQLEYQRVKTEAEKAQEFEQKERERIKREAAENIEGAKKFNNLDLPDASSKEAKRQADAQKATEALISKYTVNGRTPGTFDDRKGAEGRAALRALRIKSNGQVNWILTLKLVGAAFHHETVAEIRAAAKKEYNSWTNKDENGRRKSEQTLQGAGLGNLPRY
jgi:hypothetical protein